ncbi:unnamed protein product [Prunus armeniaca]
MEPAQAPLVLAPLASTDPAPPPPIEPAPAHPMRTRLLDGIFQPKNRTKGTVRYQVPRAFLTVIDDVEPTCFSQASKHPAWHTEISEESNALLQNQTWSLVPPFPTHTPVGCKWVFRIKRHFDGIVEHYKAYLVAKGFHQRPDIDYFETFSPIVKPATIRNVLSLAVSRWWSLRQLDVKNAFLHGFFQEDVYMVQPLGFVNLSHPTHVCKLHKSLYSLKQAPRAWFNCISTFILSISFSRSLVDSSLFIFQQGSHTIFLLMYVDDIVITGNDSSLLQNFISLLSCQFDMKNFGPFSYFLGLQVVSHDGALHLNQLKYVLDLLHKSNLLHAKPASTPLAAKSVLTTSDGDLLTSPTEYRELVGSLQYFTLTRPDISFAVNTVAQFMSSSRFPHMVALKRILRYVKGTIDFGLHFTP